MNALRAPLTALYVSNERTIVFSVDSADAFIDSPQYGRYDRERLFPIDFLVSRVVHSITPFTLRISVISERNCVEFRIVGW